MRFKRVKDIPLLAGAFLNTLIGIVRRYTEPAKIVRGNVDISPCANKRHLRGDVHGKSIASASASVGAKTKASVAHKKLSPPPAYPVLVGAVPHKVVVSINRGELLSRSIRTYSAPRARIEFCLKINNIA